MNLRKRKQTNDTTVIKKVHIDDNDMEKVISYVKKMRPSVVTFAEKLDILLVNAKLRYNHYLESKKKHPGRKCSMAKATIKVAEMLHRQKKLINDVWSGFWNEAKVSKRIAAQGNFTQKQMRIPMTKFVNNAVQEFVRSKREKWDRVVAHHVRDFLKDIGILDFDVASNNSKEAALRATQRYLERSGYKRGKKKGTKYYKLTEKICVYMMNM